MMRRCIRLGTNLLLSFLTLGTHTLPHATASTPSHGCLPVPGAATGTSEGPPGSAAAGNSTFRHIHVVDPDPRLARSQRRYKLSLPSAYRKDGPALPLLLYFHGQCGEIKDEDARFVELGEREGFITVSPGGLADGKRYSACTGWNMGSGGRLDVCNTKCVPEIHQSCLLTANMSNCNWSTCYDDVHFIKTLLAALKEEHCFDVSRVYITGASNGAMFTYRLLHEMPRATFAAAVPWYGLMLRNMFGPPAGGAGVPLLHMHGLKDKTVPPVGDTADNYYYHPLNETLVTYAAAAHCDVARGLQPTHTPYDQDQAGAGDEHSCEAYSGCDAGKPVVRCFFPKAAHGFWPTFAESITWWFMQNMTSGGLAGRDH